MRPRTRCERLERRTGAHASKREDATSPINGVVIDIDERAGRSSRESHGSERRHSLVQVRGRQTLAAQDGHSVGAGECEYERARDDAVREAHLVK